MTQRYRPVTQLGTLIMHLKTIECVVQKSLLPRISITNSFRRRISGRLQLASLLASFQPQKPRVSLEALAKVIMVMVVPQRSRRLNLKKTSTVGQYKTYEQARRQKKQEQRRQKQNQADEEDAEEYRRQRLDALLFNLQEFRTAKNRGRVITKRERVTLSKPPAERTDYDLLLLTVR
jgi:hypothetical protein